MALGPVELQVILSATRDTERVQHLQQQNPRWQQEHLALQFQKEIEDRKRQAQAVAKMEGGLVEKVEKEKRKNRNQLSKEKRASIKEDADREEDRCFVNQHTIDFLI